MNDESPIRVLIVEDERVAREHVASLLGREPNIELLGQCANGVDALRTIREAPPHRRPELLVLDVQMPEMDGLEVAEALLHMAPELETPILLFVTAFSEHMERAFELHATDYLRKPFTERRFLDALSHVRTRVGERRAAARLASGEAEPASVAEVSEAAQRLERLLMAVAEGRPRRRTAVPDGRTGDLVFITVDEVASVQADGSGRVVLHGRGPARSLNIGIERAEETLRPLGYVRVNRQWLVHPDHLQQARHVRGRAGEYVLELDAGPEVETKRSYGPAIAGLVEPPRDER